MDGFTGCLSFEALVRPVSCMQTRVGKFSLGDRALAGIPGLWP